MGLDPARRSGRCERSERAALGGARGGGGRIDGEVGARADYRVDTQLAVTLPRVLSSSDVFYYKQMFALGASGQWPRVDALVAKLSDPLLMGHVMAQRYLHPKAYRSQYAELHAWMARHADHPDADAIYRLGLRRKPKGGEPLARPARPQQTYAASGRLRPSPPAIPTGQLGRAKTRQAAALKREIRAAVWRGQTATAKQLIQSAAARQLLGPVELDDMRARLGQAYFVDGEDAWAVEWAGGAATRSGQYLPNAHWTAGLAAWRLTRLQAGRSPFRGARRTPTTCRRGWSPPAPSGPPAPASSPTGRKRSIPG